MGRRLKRREDSPEDAKWVANHQREVRDWNNAIAHVVRYAIRTTSLREFARRIRYTPSTLCTLLNQADAPRQRPWTLDNLVAIAGELHCTLSDLMAAAESVKGKPDAQPPLSLRTKGTAPHSRERLQRLIYEAVDYDGDWDETKCDRLIEVLYRVKDIECSSPDFCKAYYDGELSDADALAVLKKADALEVPFGEEPPPFWAALREVYKQR